jgi:hypothetical protein
VHRQLLAVAERFLRTAGERRTQNGRWGKVELTEERKKEAEKMLGTLGYIRGVRDLLIRRHSAID